MQELTEGGRRTVEDVARRHGVSADAALTLLAALRRGGGNQAQFSHPELGGMGQWSRGGMIMVGDMFNHALKARVDRLCTELSALMAAGSVLDPVPAYQRQSQSQGQSQSSSQPSPSVSLFEAGAAGGRWPAALGQPSSTGSQNDLHYAVFPATRRLAIERHGRITIYDTGDHQISGFSQQQSHDQSITFTSQHGLVRVADLPVVDGDEGGAVTGSRAAAPPPQSAPSEATAPLTPPQPGPSQDPAAQTPPQPAPGAAAAGPLPQPIPSEPPAEPLPAAARPAAGAGEDIFAKIERLAELWKKDILTDDEFSAKKADLLSRL